MNRFGAVIAGAMFVCYSSLALAQRSNASATRGATAELAAVDDNVVESFKIEGNGDFVLIPVTVGGHDYPFILDTRSGTSMFDTSFGNQLVQTDKKIKVNGGGTYWLFQCQNARIGQSGVPLDKPALSGDLAPLRDHGGHDIRGILGMDVLRQCVIQIDFDGARVKFLRNSEGAPGTKIPVQFDKFGCPIIQARLAGKPEVPLAIDTGLYGLDNGTFSSATFDALIRAGHMKVAGSEFVLTVNATKECRVGTIPIISIADFQHARQLFHETPLGSDALGLGYLSRYTVTLDFPGRSVFFAKGRQYDREFGHNGFGLDIGFVNGDLIVLTADGWPESCRVKSGDRILEINGRDVRSMSLYSAKLALRNLGDGAPVTMLREGGTRRAVYLRRPPVPRKSYEQESGPNPPGNDERASTMDHSRNF